MVEAIGLAFILGMIAGWGLWAEKPPRDIIGEFEPLPWEGTPQSYVVTRKGVYAPEFNPFALADDFDGQGRR